MESLAVTVDRAYVERAFTAAIRPAPANLAALTDALDSYAW